MAKIKMVIKNIYAVTASTNLLLINLFLGLIKIIPVVLCVVKLLFFTIYFKNRMTENDIRFHSFLKLQNPSMACRLVENGNYLSVLPYYSMVKSAEQEKVKILDVNNFSQTQFVQIILHTNKVIIPQIDGFLEELRIILEDVVSV